MRKWAIFFLSFIALGASVFCCILSSQLKKAKKEIATISIDPELFQKKLSQEPPEWMVRQIESDLKPYASGITLAMLNEAFRGEKINAFSLVRFTIQDRHLSFSHDERHLYSRHFRELLACIHTLNEQVELPDVDFIVSLEDGFGDNPGIDPCFVFAKRKNLGRLILVPDIKAMTGYKRLQKLIFEANPKFPWEKKLDKAFWRGSSTGGYSTKNTWNQLARSKLVLLSLAFPQMMDARFHAIVQCDPAVPSLLKAEGLVSGSVEKVDHLKYKFLIDVDGNSCSYERYFWLLASNSLVIKQITPNVQWYYGALEPYKHYVPIQEDLSDLLDKISWAKEHDAECQSIADSATQFVQDHLAAEDTLVYLYHLLTKYAAIFK